MNTAKESMGHCKWINVHIVGVLELGHWEKDEEKLIEEIMAENNPHMWWKVWKTIK